MTENNRFGLDKSFVDRLKGQDDTGQDNLIEPVPLVDSRPLEAKGKGGLDPDFVKRLKANSANSAPTNVALSQGMDENPDQYADMLNISKQTGKPVAAVKTNVEQLKKDITLKNLNIPKLSVDNPKTSQFLSNRENASVAHDDIEMLKALEDALTKSQPELDFTKYKPRHSSIGNILRRVATRGGELTEVLGDVLLQQDSFLTSNTGLFLKTMGMGAQEIADWQQFAEVTPEAMEKKFKEEGVSFELLDDFGYFVTEQGLGSFADMVLATANSPIFSAYVVSRAGEVGNTRAINEGREYGTALDTFKALPAALASVLFERVGAKGIGDAIMDQKDLADKVGVDLLKYIVKKYGKAALKEGGTELVQEGVIEYLGETAFTDVDLSVEEALKRGAWAAVAGGIAGGGMAAAPGIPMDIIAVRNSRMETATQKEQNTIDQVILATNESKLKNRSGEKLHQFVNELAPDQSIKIDAKSLDDYVNGVKEGPVEEGDTGPGVPQQKVDMEANPALAKLADQMDEAIALGGSVEISMADFVEHIIGTEHEQALRPFMKLTDGTMTPAEIQGHRDFMQEQLKMIEETVAKDEEAFNEAMVISEQVQSQLERTGKLTRGQAKLQAQIVSARMVQLANERGLTVKEAFDLAGFGGVIGPHEATQQRIDDAAVLTHPEAPVESREDGKLDSLNPTGGLFVDYTPEIRAIAPLGENMTTVDKTLGVDPDVMVTIYRGVPDEQGEIQPGDFVTTNEQLARDYAGTGKVISMEVKYSELLDDSIEPSLGEESIYRPAFDQKNTRSVNAALDPDFADSANPLTQLEEDLSLYKEAQKYESADEFIEAQGPFLYHGTNKEFDVFTPNEAQGWGLGIYLTDSKEDAETFGDTLMEVKAYLKNPYIEGETKLKDADVTGTETYKKLNEKSYEQYDVDLDWTDEWVENGRFVGSVLRELGYDGIIAEYSNNIDGKEIVAFTANQVKTKAQLTDIWNKANSESANPLAQPSPTAVGYESVPFTPQMDDVVTLIEQNGGVTLNEDGTFFDENTGYIATLRTRNIESKHVSNVNAYLKGFARTNKDLLRYENVKIGVFTIKDQDGEVTGYSVDVNIWMQDREKAIQLGRDNNQISIWDIAAEDEILTGGTSGEGMTVDSAESYVRDELQLKTIQRGAINESKRERFDTRLREGRTGLEGAINPETGATQLVHFSHSSMEETDPSRWGQSLSGRTPEEAARVKLKSAPGRTYFGIEATEKPYKRESGLGSIRTEFQIDGALLYDLKSDPEGLFEQGGDVIATNQTERNIREAGYAGYWVDSHRLGKVAAVFEPLNANPTKHQYQQPPSDTTLNQSAYHGTPHKFDRFSLDAIGTGEGAQIYGWGLYFAAQRSIGEYYRNTLANKVDLDRFNKDFAYRAAMTVRVYKGDVEKTKSILEGNIQYYEDIPSIVEKNIKTLAAINSGEYKDVKLEEGNLFQVDIPESDQLLDWDKPLSEQSVLVKESLMKLNDEYINEAINTEPVSHDDGEYWSYMGNTYNSKLEALEENSGMQIVLGRRGALGKSPKEISQTLNSIGIPGLMYLDGTSRGTGGDTHNFVIWDESVVTVEAVNDEVRQAEALAQKKEGEAIRGQYDTVSRVITLFEQADLSTFLHETAHFFLDTELRLDGVHLQPIANWWRGNAASIAAEAGVTEEDVRSYTTIGTTGDTEIDQKLYVATHEQFARAFEKYLMEGEAPSMDLRRAFRAFARWLSQIYSVMGGDLKVNIDGGIRQVFDRMLASQEQITLMRTEMDYAPLFTDAAMAGMSEEQYKAHLNKNKDAQDSATETLYDKMVKQIRRMETKWWNDELKEKIDTITDQISGQPVHYTRKVLATQAGGVKLDRAAVKMMLGVEVLPPKFRNMTLAGGEGMHPDQAAELFGFASGDELVNEMNTKPTIKEAAQGQAEAEMIKLHGDILTDGTIEEMAKEAVHNENRAELILAELKALNRGRGIAGVDKQHLKALASDNIGKLSLSKIRPERYRRAEIKAAQDARSALDSGDRDAAKQAKIRQAMNFYLYRAAMDARTEGDRIVKFMAKFRKKSIRERLARAGYEYLEQIDGILERFDFRKSTSVKKAQEARTSIDTWAAERSQAGDNIQLSEETLKETYRYSYKEIPFTQLLGIRDSVFNIDHVARFNDKMRVANEKMDFGEIKTLVLDNLDNLSTKFTYDANYRTQKGVVKPFHNAIAKLTKIPFLVRWLDGGKVAGLMHELIMQPMTDAADAEIRLWEQTATPIMAMLNNRPKSQKARHLRKFRIIGLENTETRTKTLTGSQIISIALNVGNEGNLRKMLMGEGWATTEEDATMSNPMLKQILDTMEKEDWEMVQAIWDQLDTLFPLMAQVHKASSGLDIARVEATEVVTRHGTFRGGYYPIKYDPYRSGKAQDNQKKNDAVFDSMFDGNGFMRPVSDTGAKEARSEEYFAPFALGLDLIPNHIQEVVHYITHFDAVRQAHKIVSDSEIRKSIISKLGHDEYNLFSGWLNDLAKDGRGTETKRFFEPTMARMRFGITLGAMGFKISTMMMQTLGLSNAFAFIGRKYTMKALRHVWANPADLSEKYKVATEKSKVLRHRLKTMDREMAAAFQRIEGKTGFLARIQVVSMMGIGMVQMYSADLPTWYGAYFKEHDAALNDLDVENFGSAEEMEQEAERRAVIAADWAVENVQGSGSLKDQSEIMRDRNEFWRMFTMFNTFFSALWNTQRDLVRGTKSGQYNKAQALWMFMLMYIIPTALEMIIRDGFPDEDDEPEALFQQYLTNLALYPATTVPVLRDVVHGTLGNYGYTMSPLAGLLEKGIKGGKSVLADPTDASMYSIKSGTKLAGAYLGIPGTGQFWNTYEHLLEVNEGEEFSTHQLLFGPKKD